MNKTLKITIIVLSLIILINAGLNIYTNYKHGESITDLEQEIAKTWIAIEHLENQACFIDSLRTNGIIYGSGLIWQDSIIDDSVLEKLLNEIDLHQKAGYNKIDMNE